MTQKDKQSIINVNMKNKLQPSKVTKIFCPICKELQVKFYPWSSYHIAEGENSNSPCIKCANKNISKTRKKLENSPLIF